MRNNGFLLVALLVLFTSTGMAQTNIDIKRKDFKSDNAGFREAWGHVEKGDEYYISKGVFYGYAFDEYMLALNYNDSNPELNYKAGVSALLSDRKEAAADLFLKAFSLDKNVIGDILLVTGRALQYAGRYDEAIEKLNEYLNSPGKRKSVNSDLAKKTIIECNSALIVTNDTLNAVIENMGANINSSSDDYSEVISSDGKIMYFASRRETPKSSDFYSDYKFDENIFMSGKTGNSWEPSVSAGKSLTTRYCEAPLFLNKLNDELFIYEGSENLGDIKVSVTKYGKWSVPRLIPYRINTSGRETSFTINPSEDEIWYVTEQGKGNMGGKDIYFIKKTVDGKWSKPVNAGSSVNTVYDEESVRFSASGDTLYFSSKGHNTIGGFDIFYVTRDTTGTWSAARNFGFPVNTPWDEIFFHPSPVNPNDFFFVSNRSGGFGYCDIYTCSLNSIPEYGVIASAVIFTPVDSVAGEVITPVDSLSSKVYSDTDSVQLILPDAVVSDLKKTSDTLSASTVTVNVGAAATLNEVITVSEPLPAIVPELVPAIVSDVPPVAEDIKNVVFQNLYFDLGKSSLNEAAMKVLASNLEIFRKYPGLKVEIAGHTEKSDNESFNFKISEERAKVVRDYFLKNGIDGSRMEVSQYGSLMPVSNNNTREGKAKNNRVEIKIREF